MTITPYVPPAGLSSLPNGIWSGTLGLPVLPYLPGQNPNVSKSMRWATGVARAVSGRERRTAWWPYPLWEFSLSYGVIRHRPTNDELMILWEFFGVMKGQFAPFLVVDPTDCYIAVGNAVQFGTGDGLTTTFQLSRTINSFAEPVYDVYSPTLLDNGGAAGAYSIGANGLVSFSVAPAAGHALTWYGYFYFGCRFMQDDLDFEQVVNLLWSGKSLKFTSLRV